LAGDSVFEFSNPLPPSQIAQCQRTAPVPQSVPVRLAIHVGKVIEISFTEFVLRITDGKSRDVLAKSLFAHIVND
jgi:hypothetical protein